VGSLAAKNKISDLSTAPAEISSVSSSMTGGFELPVQLNVRSFRCSVFIVMVNIFHELDFRDSSYELGIILRVGIM